MGVRPNADDPLDLDAFPGGGRYWWDAATDILSWSPGLCAIYGIDTPPTIAGFVDLVHPDDRGRVQATVAGMMAQGQHYQQSFRIQRPDGTIRHLLDRGTIHRDAAGAATRIVGISIDITDAMPVAPAATTASGRPNTADSWLRQIIEQAPATFAMLDSDMRYLFASKGYCAEFGKRSRDLIDHCHYDVLPDNSAALRTLHPRVMAGETVAAEEQRPRADGKPDWVRWTMSPWRLLDGSIGGAILILEQVTTRVLARQKLAESEARLADALRAGGLGVHDYDPRTGRIVWDATTRAIWGIPEDEDISFAAFEAGIHPDDMAETQRRIAAALDPAGDGRYEAVYRVRHRQTGAIRWVRADGAVSFENGVATRLVGTTADVTTKKEMEEQIQVLMGEVNHRTRNLLSVVQAIARHTGQGDPDTFLARFDKRIAALAASQELLISNEWRGVDLSDLLRSQLAHFHDLLDTRIRLNGPDVQLTAAAAQTLGMAFHELATNAAKYGALSNPAGTVAINWQLIDRTSRRLAVEWREQGGPPVRPPRRTGFGSTVIGRAAESGLQGKVSMDYAPEGFIWRAECGPQTIVPA
jgi:PAS domain S-box-containing protein